MSRLSSLGWLLIFITALITAAANLLLRKGIDAAGGFSGSNLVEFLNSFIRLLFEPLFLIGFFLYFSAALFWFRVIATESLVIAYPLLVSVSFILVTLGTAFFLHETLNVRIIAGIAIIIFGVTLISRGAPL